MWEPLESEVNALCPPVRLSRSKIMVIFYLNGSEIGVASWLANPKKVCVMFIWTDVIFIDESGGCYAPLRIYVQTVREQV